MIPSYSTYFWRSGGTDYSCQDELTVGSKVESPVVIFEMDSVLLAKFLFFFSLILS